MSAIFKSEGQTIYKELCQKFQMKPKPIILTAEEKRMKRVIPVRAEDFVCPLQTDYIEEKLGQGILNNLKLSRFAAYEALNFVDGQRSILDIAKAVSAEYGRINVQDVYDFFSVLERAELVKFKKKMLPR